MYSSCRSCEAFPDSLYGCELSIPLSFPLPLPLPFPHPHPLPLPLPLSLSLSLALSQVGMKDAMQVLISVRVDAENGGDYRCACVRAERKTKREISWSAIAFSLFALTFSSLSHHIYTRIHTYMHTRIHTHTLTHTLPSGVSFALLSRTLCRGSTPRRTCLSLSLSLSLSFYPSFLCTFDIWTIVISKPFPVSLAFSLRSPWWTSTGRPSCMWRPITDGAISSTFSSLFTPIQMQSERR